VAEYYSKSHRVEAIRYDGSNMNEIADWLRARCVVVREVADFPSGGIEVKIIRCLERVGIGGWIVRQEDGEVYSCMDETFTTTFGPIVEAT
jgi:hypothetical protein